MATQPIPATTRPSAVGPTSRPVQLSIGGAPTSPDLTLIPGLIIERIDLLRDADDEVQQPLPLEPVPTLVTAALALALIKHLLGRTVLPWL